MPTLRRIRRSRSPVDACGIFSRQGGGGFAGGSGSFGAAACTVSLGSSAGSATCHPVVVGLNVAAHGTGSSGIVRRSAGSASVGSSAPGGHAHLAAGEGAAALL